MTYFGARLRYLRKQDGLSQQQLADALGTAKSSISMYENGHREPSFEVLEQLADYFNVPMGTFFSDGHVPEPTSSAEIQPMNTIRIAGRNGSLVERQLTDEQLALFQSMLDQMKPIDDENI